MVTLKSYEGPEVVITSAHITVFNSTTPRGYSCHISLKGTVGKQPAPKILDWELGTGAILIKSQWQQRGKMVRVSLEEFRALVLEMPIKSSPFQGIEIVPELEDKILLYFDELFDKAAA